MGQQQGFISFQDIKPPSAEDFTPPSAAPEGSAVGRLASNYGAMVNPITAILGLLDAVRHPLQTGQNIVSAQVDQGRQAIANAKAGQYSEAIGHGAASLLPLIGPAAAGAGEQMGSGDVAGGLGSALGLLTTVFAPEGVRGARKVLNPAAERASAALEKSANADVEHAFNPTTRRNKVKTQDIAPEVRARGITGTIEDVRGLAKDQKQAVGEQLDAELMKNRKVAVTLQPVRDALAAESADTYNMVKQPDGRLASVVHDPRKAAQVDKVRAILDKYGDTMTTEQAVAVRRAWDDVVAKAGGYDEKSGAFGQTLDDTSEAGVKRPLANALRKQLAEANPSVAALNKEYGFWADLDQVTSATQARRVGQRRNLTRQIVRGGAMAAAGAGGGGVTGAAVAGEAASRLEQLFNSPRWKLASAQVKTKLADALASGDQDRIAAAIGRATAAINALSTSPSGRQSAPAGALPQQP